MGFSRQESWNTLPFPPPGIFLIQGSNLCPLYWQVVSSPLSLLGSQQKTGFCHLVAQSCPTLCDPVDCSTPGIPVLHHLPEFAQTHVHGVSDAVQPSCPLLSPSSPVFNLSSIRVFSKYLALRRRIDAFELWCWRRLLRVPWTARRSN